MLRSDGPIHLFFSPYSRDCVSDPRGGPVAPYSHVEKRIFVSPALLSTVHTLEHNRHSELTRVLQAPRAAQAIVRDMRLSETTRGGSSDQPAGTAIRHGGSGDALRAVRSTRRGPMSSSPCRR